MCATVFLWKVEFLEAGSSPSTAWDLGIELWISGLAANAFSVDQSHQPSPTFILNLAGSHRLLSYPVALLNPPGHERASAAMGILRSTSITRLVHHSLP